MKLFLAGTNSRGYLVTQIPPRYVLESFYYIQDWQKAELRKRTWDMFLLDSGAFTFMSNSKTKVDWNEYIQRYIDFINEYDITYFFELDIDSVVGYDNVLKLRAKLEQGTHKQCIPVWHKSRGIDEFKKLCEEYKYIAIGGLVTKEITKKEYGNLKKLVAYAKSKGVKVHGLGFTNKDAYTYGFYSVDSTNWLSSSRFGGVDVFNGKEMQKISPPQGKKGVHYKLRDEFVLKEWIKYQNYLDARQ